MAKVKGRIVTVEVFVSDSYIKEQREATLNTKDEIASIVVEETLEEAGFGYQVKGVRKSG